MLRCYYFLYFLALVTSFSCSSPSYEEWLKSPQCTFDEERFELIQSNQYSLHIPEDKSSEFYHRQYVEEGDSVLYSYIDRAGDCIYYFDLKSGGFRNQVCINDLKYNKIINYYIHSSDSIFVGLTQLMVGLMNSNGEIINTWELADYSKNQLPDYYFSKDRSNLFFDGDYLHINVAPVDLWLKSPEKRPVTNLAINVHTGEQKEYGKYQDIYIQDTDEREIPEVRCYPHTLVLADEVIHSFPISHQLYRLNWKAEGASVTSYCASSDNIERLHPLLSPAPGMQEQINYQIEAPYYGPVVYHASLDIYSRQAEQAMELLAPDGRLNSPVRRKRSLLIFDNALNLLQELDIPDGHLMDGKEVPVSNGFLVPLVRSRENENLLEVVHLKISEI